MFPDFTRSRLPLVAGCGAAFLLSLTPSSFAQQAADHGEGAASEPVPSLRVQLQWGDFDGDGLDDALTLTPNGGLRLLQNLGDGSFSDATEQAGLAHLAGTHFVLWQDYNGDGLADLFVGLGGASLLLENQGGTFRDVARERGLSFAGAARAAHWLDYDGDGLLDLHLVSVGANTLHHALPGGVFEPVTLAAAAISGTPRVSTTTEVAPTQPVDVASPEVPVGANPERGRRSAGGAGIESGTRAPVAAQGPLGQPAGEALVGENLLRCVESLNDSNGGACLRASSVATLGMLYPLSDKFFVEEVSGRVGIGTTAPGTPLHVTGGTDLSLTNGGYVMSGSESGLNIALDDNEMMARNNGAPSLMRINRDGGNLSLGAGGLGGNFGIGTEVPSRNLHIVSTGPATVRIEADTDNVNESDEAGIELVQDGGINSAFVGYRNGLNEFEVATTGGNPLVFSTSSSERMRVNQLGNVQIGTIHNGARLNVGGGIPATLSGGGEIFAGLNNGQNVVIDQASIMARVGSNVGTLNLNRLGGTVKVGNSGNPTPTQLVVQGGTDATTTTGGDLLVGTPGGENLVFDSNEIMARSGGAASTLYLNNDGGDVRFGGAIVIDGGSDIVERFESSCGLIEPGTVVVIDPDRAGRLTCSSTAYDPKVAGIVSGAGGVNPGLCLSQTDVLDGDTSVAMAGRVYVKCCIENGPIRPGDRLTTASLAGHAMRATDTQLSDGSVLGKAMSSLDAETGLVLVLVNLQ